MRHATFYRSVARSLYLSALSAARLSRGAEGLCVSEPEADEYFLHSDGRSGFAIRLNPVGCPEFVGVFSHADARGRLAGMVAEADAYVRSLGFETYALDCFEGLAEVYARHGFREYDRVAFDWEFAPEGWTPDMGEPDVVFMVKALTEDASALIDAFDRTIEQALAA